MRYTSFVHPSSSRIRRLLVPLGLIGLAILLTVPWTFWVILAAYDRDILQNAVMLARRVESNMQSGLVKSPVGILFVKNALQAELRGDRAVEIVLYVDLSAANTGRGVFYRRDAKLEPPPWDEPEIRRRASSGVLREQRGNNYQISIPYVKDDKVLGFTYVELSRAALRDEFWAKEGPLLKRVLALTAAAVLFLTILGFIAWRTRTNSQRVQQRAQLQQQGLLAERGLTAAVLAHEIRNPLAALRFQLSSLRRGADDASRVIGTADTIDSELLRIQRLVDDYLKHEKAVTLHTSSVDLLAEARKLESLLSELLRSTETRLLLSAPATPVNVACDPHALRQVLMNLVLNAQQAMKRGGSITLRLSRDEHFGLVEVADTGPGIPTEMQDRLFKPFQTTKSEGTGIGLALVKRFVDNFGGQVNVESELGKGATFTLRLPLAPDDRTEAATPLASSIDATRI